MIKKIVAEYEVCKKAWDIGLRVESVFRWHNNHDRFVEFGNANEFNALYYTPAPTCEEVPLPKEVGIWVKYGVKAQPDVEGFFNIHKIQTHYDESVIIYGYQYFEEFSEVESFSFSELNEATARLKMAIWLIENMPEARQWYVDNGYLVEVEM